MVLFGELATDLTGASEDTMRNSYTLLLLRQLISPFQAAQYLRAEYLKWITIKNLQCRAWTSAQCYVAAWMGEEFRGEGIHMYVWLKLHTFHCSPETITTLLISNTPIQTKKLLKKIFNSCKERAPKWCVLHEPKSDLDEWMAHR